MIKTDIVIVGAGIAGLTAAIYLKRANAKFAIVEGDKIGGKLNILTHVENYPGFSSCSGLDIAQSLLDQIKDLEINIEKGNVQTILKDPYGFKVVTSGESYISKAVIVASGYQLNPSFIPGEKEYLGHGVSYCATCDGNFFKNKDVAVVGNNATAIEEALYLSNMVKKLYFVVPDKKLLGDKTLIETLQKQSNVEIILKTKLVAIKGDDFGVKEIEIGDKTLPVDGVFNYTGSKNASDFLSQIMPTMEYNFIVTDEKMMSDVEGLFAIGDIRKKNLKQLVTAASDGAIAATEVNKFILNISK